MNENFVLLEKSVTFSDIKNAVKMKWGYVLMGDIFIDVVNVGEEVKLKITVKQ